MIEFYLHMIAKHSWLEIHGILDFHEILAILPYVRNYFSCSSKRNQISNLKFPGKTAPQLIQRIPKLTVKLSLYTPERAIWKRWIFLSPARNQSRSPHCPVRRNVVRFPILDESSGDMNHNSAVLWQVHSLVRNEFTTDCDLVHPISISSLLYFPFIL